MNGAMDEYFAYVEEANKNGDEFSKDSLIEKYAKEYGVDKDELEYAILKNDQFGGTKNRVEFQLGFFNVQCLMIILGIQFVNALELFA